MVIESFTLPSGMFDCASPRDAVEPNRERLGIAHLSDLADHSKPRLLPSVLGQLIAAEQAREIVAQRRVVEGVQFLPCRAVADLAFDDQQPPAKLFDGVHA